MIYYFTILRLNQANNIRFESYGLYSCIFSSTSDFRCLVTLPTWRTVMSSATMDHGLLPTHSLQLTKYSALHTAQTSSISSSVLAPTLKTSPLALPTRPTLTWRTSWSNGGRTLLSQGKVKNWLRLLIFGLEYSKSLQKRNYNVMLYF